MGWEYTDPTPMRAPLVITALLAGCATAPAGPPGPAPEVAFRGVTSLALVHRVAWRGGSPAPGEVRRRDPLDALQASAADRGLRTITVELPERPPEELEALDRLVREVEWHAEQADPGAGGQAVGSVGGRAAPVLDGLGAGALAIFARGWGRAPGPPMSPFLGRPAPLVPAQPVSSLALVARDGTVLAWSWGGAADPFYATGPANAAEAVDAALAALAPTEEGSLEREE